MPPRPSLDQIFQGTAAPVPLYQPANENERNQAISDVYNAGNNRPSLDEIFAQPKPQQNPTMPQSPQHDYSMMGDIGQMGQSFTAGMKDVGDLFNKDTWTGANLQGTPASQKLQNDAVQGNWSSLPLDVIKRMNEGMAGNPAGKVLGAVGGMMGAPLAPAVNATTDTLEKIGIPKDVTQFGMNISPMFMRGLDTDRAAPAVDDQLAQRMTDLGIPLKQSQINGGVFSKTLDSWAKGVPGSGTESFNNAQAGAFNKAVAKTFGEDATKITPDVIDNAYERIGDMYDNVLKGKQIPFTQKTLQDFADIDAKTAFLDPAHRSIVTNQLDKIMNEAIANNGLIKGETLGAMRSTVSNGIKSAPPGASMLLRELRDSIIDMSGTAAPQLKQANAQYAALKTVEPLAIKATESGGNISPALLQNQVVKSIGKAEYARGGSGNLGDLADLARGGQKYLKDPIANSQTANRAFLYGSLGDIGSTALAALMTGDVTPLAAGLGGIGATVAGSRLFNMRNTNQTAVGNLLEGQPNSYSFTRLHPANISGISLNKTQEDVKQRE